MKRFNVRVYGLWLNDEGKVLISKEHYLGKELVKFPGGGLEWGEGLADALVREWKEELGMDIAVRQHVYTTHFFQASAFDDSQIISIYYRVQALQQVPTFPYQNQAGDYFYFEELNNQLKAQLSLPIDQYVAEIWEQWKA